MSNSDNDYEYILYIDEAGDDGLTRVKPIDADGASEWLCISGFLISRNYEGQVVEWVRDIREDIAARQGPALHFRTLSPTKKARACAIMSGLPVRAFAVCSHKPNMKGHRNERAAARHGKQWFYNYCVRLLMERVTDICLRSSQKRFDGEVRPIRVVFSQRGGHSYGQTKAYWEILKAQASGGSTFLDKRVIRHQTLRFGLVEYVPHTQVAGLQLADVIASAFYQAVDANSSRWTTSYAIALAPIMARERGVVADFGLVMQPTRSDEITLTEDQRRIFRHYGYTL